jgi:hypothetical protein
MRTPITLRGLFLTCLFLLLACGGRKGDVEVAEPETAPEVEEEEDDGGMQIEGLTGSLSMDEVRMVMNEGGIMKIEMCLNWIYTKRDYSFGEVEFLFRVKSDGKVDNVKILHSELGDYELEKCLIKKLSYTRFPKPKGGATEVTYSFTIDLPSGTRAPDSISSGMTRTALEEYEDDIKDCMGGTGIEGLNLIMYLGESYSEEVEVPGKKKNKTKTMDFCHVLAVGGVLPEGAPEDAMQCIFDASKGWKVPMDAGTYVSKVSITF